VSSNPETDSRVDVDAIVSEIQRKAAGSRTRVDALFLAGGAAGGEVVAEAQLERVEDAALIVPNVTVGRSTRRFLGPLIEKAKGFIVRANGAAALSAAEQQTRFNAEIVGYARVLGAEVAKLRQGHDGTEALARLSAIEARLEELETRIQQIAAGGGPHSQPST
jgi:hypothetical protein